MGRWLSKSLTVFVLFIGNNSSVFYSLSNILYENDKLARRFSGGATESEIHLKLIDVTPLSKWTVIFLYLCHEIIEGQINQKVRTVHVDGLAR